MSRFALPGGSAAAILTFMLLLLGSALAAAPTSAEIDAQRAVALRVLEGRVRAAPHPADLLRLGELWQQDAEARELRALDAYVARYDACHDAPGCDLALVAPDLADANRSRQRATVRYRQLLRDFPESDEADDAAYGLGWAWRAMGEEALGDAAFTWLVAARPDSAYATDAWLLVGERAFEAWEADWARHAFTRVAESEDPRRSWALHRLGWSYYRLGDYPRAIDALRRVVSEPPAADIPGAVDMRDEALKDLVRFYADAGELDEPYGGCRLGRREDVRTLLVFLADTYEEQGKREQAIQTWRRLVAEDPDGPDVVAYIGRIVHAYRDMSRFDDAVADLDRLVRAVDARPDDTEAAAVLERATRNLAFDLHRWGRSSGFVLGQGGFAPPQRPPDAARKIALAEELYTLHGERFADAEHAPDIAWAHAVALEDLGRYAEAAERYRALAESDPVGRYARDAAAAAERLER